MPQLSQLSSVFNIPVTTLTTKMTTKPAPRFGPAAAAEGTEGTISETEQTTTTGSTGAFTSPQTFVSFTGATAVIGVIWQTIKAFVQIPSPLNLAILLAISLIISFLIYWINISAKDYVGDRRVAAVMAVFNALFLFAATKAIVPL